MGIWIIGRHKDSVSSMENNYNFVRSILITESKRLQSLKLKWSYFRIEV